MSSTVTVSGSQDTTYVASAADTTYDFAPGSDLAPSVGEAIDASSEAKHRDLHIYGAVEATGIPGLMEETAVVIGSADTHQGGGDLVIGAAGQVTAYTGVVANGNNQTIENSGKITASYMGVLTTGTHTAITNSDTVSSGDFAISMTGAGSSVHNTGNIDGAVSGVRFKGDDATLINDFHIGSSEGNGVEAFRDATIVNHGDIEGMFGAYFGGKDTSVHQLTNAGSISGEVAAVSGSAGQEIIRNTGTITGDIDLDGGNDVFFSHGGSFSGVVHGGAGNDKYTIDAALQLQENAGEGRDTVRSSVSFTLPDNFEILQVTGSAIIGVGNASNNRLIGNNGDNLLGGGAGDDRITGHGGADTFVFKSGDNDDTVTDFQASGKHHDIAALAFAGIDSFADLKTHMSQHGNDVVLTFDNGDSLTLQHLDMHDLTAADFVFS
jgi:Ca2+-binding RTX toxin-like protein